MGLSWQLVCKASLTDSSSGTNHFSVRGSYPFYTVFLLFLSLVLLLCSAQALADKQRYQAALSIVNPLEFSPLDAPDFGELRLLPGESCSLDSRSELLKGDACFSDSGELASLTIAGSEFYAIGVSVSVEENAALVFAPEIHSASFNSASSAELVIDQKQYAIEIGGTLSIPENGAEQLSESAVQTLAYSVQITYQ